MEQTVWHPWLSEPASLCLRARRSSTMLLVTDPPNPHVYAQKSSFFSGLHFNHFSSLSILFEASSSLLI